MRSFTTGAEVWTAAVVLVECRSLGHLSIPNRKAAFKSCFFNLQLHPVSNQTNPRTKDPLNIDIESHPHYLA